MLNAGQVFFSHRSASRPAVAGLAAGFSPPSASKLASAGLHPAAVGFYKASREADTQINTD